MRVTALAQESMIESRRMATARNAKSSSCTSSMTGYHRVRIPLPIMVDKPFHYEAAQECKS